jgi:flavin-dependent dehydrogenase
MKPITIIGGGLAGLTIGILLRTRGISVTLIESGRYPRHRVCGEFISGAGITALKQSHLLEALPESDTRLARDVAFFSEIRSLGNRLLPTPALCISRFMLDAFLAEQFQKLGGELRLNERWRGSFEAAGIVCATGRRAHPVENGWRWFGLKAHARGVTLHADLEMHVARESYVGLCRLADGSVNVCGLFRRRVADAVEGESVQWLRGKPGTPLFDCMKDADFDPASRCAVGGLSLRPEGIDPHECRIGDALTMIPPITGNGMSMAFESARIAFEPLAEYAEGRCDWTETTRNIAERLRAAFARRLRWAGLFHRALFSRGGLAAAPMILRFEPAWRGAFAVTR